MMERQLITVAAVNDDGVLSANIMRSPDVAAGRIGVLPQRGHRSAGAAYNAGLEQASGDVVAFVHQDVYLPPGWVERLERAISSLDQQGERWGVLGVWGIRPEGQYVGRVWCSGGNCEHVGAIGGVVAEVASIDEIVIVLNRKAGLRFDENLPGFHLYATDIILQARQKGYKAFVFDGPVVHNSRPNPQVFDRHFFDAYRYMQRKWADQLPLLTCTVPVTRWGWPLYRQWLRKEVNRRRGRTTGGRRVDDPRALAVELGYESPAAAAIAGRTSR